MKLIFLDIDWVLHPFLWNEDFCQKQINNLMYIINKTWAKIIISSDWKYWLEHLYSKWHETILPPYLGHTDRNLLHSYKNINFENIREKEIESFLKVCDEWNDNIESWIVIDDMNLNIKNLILCSSNIWLTKELADEAIKILNK